MKDIHDKCQISDIEKVKYDLYGYTEDSNDIQPLINNMCDIHKAEIDALHKMYRELLGELKHKYLQADARADGLNIAIDTHNQKMLGNIK